MPESRQPERIDLGALPSPSGFFLPRDAVQRPFEYEPDAHGKWRFGATYRNSPQTLRQQVLELVRAARRKVFVTSFILGDDALTRELVAAAERLTGGVYVISELSERSLRIGLARLAEEAEKGKTREKIGPKVEQEKKRFMSLTRRGVALRGHEHCHAKFVVVDDAIAWVGSANLETGAFTEVGEVGVVTTDPPEVNRLTRLFARMWLSGCRWELPNASTYGPQDLADTRPADIPFTVPAPSPAPGRPALIWTDHNDDSLRRTLHEIIGNATRSLLLASFSLNGMDGRRDLLVNPVSDAIARGVKVTLLVRANNHRERHRRDAAVLHELGVRILADRLNHAKAAVADSTAGALFSANFDAQHGLDPGSGIEIGARLDGTPALTELERYLRNALSAADLQFVATPLQRQLNDERVLRKSQLWPLPSDIRIRASPSVWRRFARDTTNAPALWTRHDDEPVELLVGHGRWPLFRDNNGQFRLIHRRETEQSAADLLKQWEAKRPRDITYGYCPAVLTHVYT